MISTPASRRKVVVVGAGAVGSTYCYALAQSGLAEQIAIIDANADLARGQVLDLVHGQAFFPAVSITVGTPEDYADASLIVITAGAAQRPGETRLQLLRKNAAITRSIVSEIIAQNSQAVLLMVNNPVDVMTQVALAHTGWDRTRVIGSGTVLDSARLRQILSAYCGIDAHNVHAYVLGEHGDSEFVAWSLAHVGGLQMDQYVAATGRHPDWPADKARIETEVRHSAYHIIDYKGATYFAVGLALVRITGAILRGQRSVHTLSVRLEGEFGLNGVCLSVPCVVSSDGIERLISSPLSPSEQAALEASASVLSSAFTELTQGV